VIFGTGRDLERLLPGGREWFEVQPLAAGPRSGFVTGFAFASLGKGRTPARVSC